MAKGRKGKGRKGAGKGKGSHKGAHRKRRASCRKPAAVAVSKGGGVFECCWGHLGKAEVLNCHVVSAATLKRRNLVKEQREAATKQRALIEEANREMNLPSYEGHGADGLGGYRKHRGRW